MKNIKIVFLLSITYLVLGAATHVFRMQPQDTAEYKLGLVFGGVFLVLFIIFLGVSIRMFINRGKKILIHDESKCINCGACGKCPHKALKVDAAAKTWEQKGLCMGCNWCVKKCQAGALSLDEKLK